MKSLLAVPDDGGGSQASAGSVTVARRVRSFGNGWAATAPLRRRRRRRPGDQGMATVELAAALPVLMLLVLAGVFGVRVADSRARAADVAGEVARSIARGMPDPDAGSFVRGALGPTASVTVSSGADQVEVIVRVMVRPIGVNLAAITVIERAIAAKEPTAEAVAAPVSASVPGDPPGRTG